jgi:PKD domain
VSRSPAKTAVIALLAALCSLTAVASAGAAAWQPTLQLSDPGVNVGITVNSGETTARIALGASGDAAAGWWDAAGGGRIVLDRKRAGAGWSGPVPLASSATLVPVSTGVDASGDVTAVYTTGTGVSNIAQWPAGAPAPTTAPLAFPGALTINDLAVDAAGDAVLVGIDNATPAQAHVGYRQGFNGAFVFHVIPTTAAAQTARVAINAAGMAVVVVRTQPSGLFGAASSDWTQVKQVTTQAVEDTYPTVGIDGAGNAVAAFTYGNGTASVIRASRLASGFLGGWQESADISNPAAGMSGDAPNVAVDPAGIAVLVWSELGGMPTDNGVIASIGSTGTGLWGHFETVDSEVALFPEVAIGNDGTAVATWEHQSAAVFLGQARVRSPITGAWGDRQALTTDFHSDLNEPRVATDGLGDFGIISAPADSNAVDNAVVSVYDAAPPAMSPVVVSGTFAEDPITLSLTAADAWSSTGTPTWTFGDGGTGTGLSVAHTYAAPGTYKAHVSVSDGSGNTSGEDATVVVSAQQATLTTAAFSAKWKLSRVSGTLKLAGTAPRAGTYAVNVTKGTASKLHASFSLPVGVFSKAIKLPATLVPGTYTVRLVPADTVVLPAGRSATLAAPTSGVVDVAFLSGARNGTPTRTLSGATTIWASFHFAAVPKGKLTLTWYRLGKARVRIGSVAKTAAAKIVSYLRLGKVFSGTYEAVLTRKGVEIAQTSVKAKP